MRSEWGIAVSLLVTSAGCVGAQPGLAKDSSGDGDVVYQGTGLATNWAIGNEGEGNCVVTNRGEGVLGHDLLVNEIGRYDGSVPVKAGPAVTTQEPDGSWAIKQK
jgi:hypothetical protein